jgi:hypothetical protein
MYLYRGKEVVFELVFYSILLLTVAWTMPQAGGKTPMELWSSGYRPKQADVRDGFLRLGVSPGSQPALWIIQRFPN